MSILTTSCSRCAQRDAEVARLTAERNGWGDTCAELRDDVARLTRDLEEERELTRRRFATCERLTRKLEEARALLDDLAESGVSFDDGRLRYVEVQVERPVWDRLQRWKKGEKA